MIKAWNILKDLHDDIYAEDEEDTDEYYAVGCAYKELGTFLDMQDIEYEEVNVSSCNTDEVIQMLEEMESETEKCVGFIVGTVQKAG